MVKGMAKLVITVDYTVNLPDEKIANFMADLAEKHGLNFGSENYGVWDFDPEDVVTKTEVIK